MGNTSDVGCVISWAALITGLCWLVVSVGFVRACWKHDRYLKKHYPDKAREMSVSVFGGNWNGVSSVRNMFSFKPTMDSHIAVLRRKVKLWALVCWAIIPLWIFLFIAAIAISSLVSCFGVKKASERSPADGGINGLYFQSR